MKPCPYCAETIQDAAIVCRWCGRDLVADDVPPKAGSLSPHSERKLVTALFADLVGSTAIGERNDVEGVQYLMTSYFSAMSAAIEAWGGTVEKFIGDAILAYFGIPAVREDDADRAVRAALEMLDRLHQLNQRIERQHGVVLSARIGINTGEVIVPSVGAVEQVIGGDVVNVASRLQQSVDPGAILLGERTSEAVRDSFELESVELEVKGRNAAVRANRVGRTVTAHMGRRLRLQSPLVGREDELKALGEQFAESLASTTPRLVMITGAAGIGKSRLVREFVLAVEKRDPEPQVLFGRCVAAGSGTTYAAFSGILRETCGISITDPPEIARHKLEEAVQRLFADSGGSQEDAASATFALAITAGIQIPDNPLDAERPLALSRSLARAWTGFIAACAARSGAILVIEDLHWASEPTIELIERLMTRTSGAVLFVASTRPYSGVHPLSLGGGDALSVLSLKPLTGQEGLALAQQLLLSTRLPEEVVVPVLEKVEGNPLFLEEMLAQLVEQGHLVRHGEGWESTGTLDASELPNTIAAVLGARIDALAPTEKRVLQEASVFGRVFWEAPLAAALGRSDVAENLFDLEDKGLVGAATATSFAGQIQYRFKHALIRDVAYANLPKADRARSHARAARWLEESAGSSIDEVLEPVALHYLAAVVGEGARLAWIEDPQRLAELKTLAFERLLQAGAAARLRADASKAVELHEQALGLATSSQDRAKALEAIGDDHDTAFHGDQATEAWESALSTLRQDPDADETRAAICLKAAVMVVLRWGGFRVPAPADIGDRFIDEGLQCAKDRTLRTELLALRAICVGRWAWSGKPDPMPIAARRQAAQEAEALRDRDDHEMEAFVIEAMANVCYAEGSYSETLQLVPRLLEIADSSESARDSAYAHLTIALAESNVRGRYDLALRHARRAYELARPLSPHDQMHATWGLMDCFYNLGEWDAIMPIASEHAGLFQGKEADQSCPYLRSGPLIGALVMAHRGDAQNAIRAAAQVRPDEANPGMAETTRASLALALGDPQQAIEILDPLVALRRRPSHDEIPREALVMVEALVALEEWQRLDRFVGYAKGMSGVVAGMKATCDRAEGLSAQAAGDLQTGEGLLRKAAAGFEELSMQFELARTLEALAPLARREEKTILDRALQIYEQLGASPHAARVQIAR